MRGNDAASRTSAHLSITLRAGVTGEKASEDLRFGIQQQSVCALGDVLSAWVARKGEGIEQLARNAPSLDWTNPSPTVAIGRTQVRSIGPKSSRVIE